MIHKADAERRRRALRQFMAARGLEPAEWARRAGLTNANSIYNFLRGRAASLSQKTLEALASAEGVSVSELTGESLVTLRRGLTRLEVRGEVQAGAWKEAIELPPDERFVITLYSFDLPSGVKTYGLLVRGTSMDKIYPPGTVIEVVNLPDFWRELRNGDKVVVYRRNREGLIEATCKEFQKSDSTVWLWPRSNDPAYQQPFSFPWPPRADSEPRDDGVESVEIRAVVVRSIRPEV